MPDLDNGSDPQDGAEAFDDLDTRALQAVRDRVESCAVDRLDTDCDRIVGWTAPYEESIGPLVVPPSRRPVFGWFPGDQSDHIGEDGRQEGRLGHFQDDVSEFQFMIHSYSPPQKTVETAEPCSNGARQRVHRLPRCFLPPSQRSVPV